MWKAKEDYSKYPEKEWCDCDYIAAWIKSTGYSPKTSMENLVEMVIFFYDNERLESSKEFYTDITKSENGDGWMISTYDVSTYVRESGGLEMFDFES